MKQGDKVEVEGGTKAEIVSGPDCEGMYCVLVNNKFRLVYHKQIYPPQVLRIKQVIESSLGGESAEYIARKLYQAGCRIKTS